MTGMCAYTRRTQPDGTVKVFLRNATRYRLVLVVTRDAARAIPANRPLTIEID